MSGIGKHFETESIGRRVLQSQHERIRCYTMAELQYSHRHIMVCYFQLCSIRSVHWDYDSGWIPGDQMKVYHVIKKTGHNRHRSVTIEVDSYDMKSNHHY